MAENKYKKTEEKGKARLSVVAGKTGIPHRERKSPKGAEDWARAKRARNAARGKQVWVPSSFQGTIADLDAMSDAEVLAIVPAHWERIQNWEREAA